MHILTDWSISRSGAFMRVTGTDQGGEARRITAKVVRPRAGRVVGVDRDGIEFQLAV